MSLPNTRSRAVRNKRRKKTIDADVVILAGGRGTRLRKTIGGRPKVMVEVNGRPFLDYIIEHFSRQGFRRFIICTGYRADLIERYYRSRKTAHIVIFSRERRPLGTGGAVRHARRHIRSASFFVVNGDSFCPVDLKGFYEAHLREKNVLSLVVGRVKVTQDYGTIVLDGSKRIIAFEEKRRARTAGGYVSAGVYLFRKEMLSLIPAGKRYSLERDFFPRMVKRGVYGYISGKRFLDIGTPRRLREASRFFTRRMKGEQR